jgi:hypothetical protein
MMPEIFCIEEVVDADWQEAEQFWIAYFRFVGADLLNQTAGGDGIHCFRHSEGTKERQSESARRRYQDDAERSRTGDAVRRAYLDPEKKRRLVEAVSRRDAPDPTALIAASRSPEERAARRSRMLGKPRTDDQKRMISEAKKGVPLWSAEQRAAMSESRRGRKHSEETKAKMRASRLARLASSAGK